MTQKLIPMVEGYKIFNDDLTCRGFQFKMGMNELDNDRPLELCGNGFHFCKYPSGVWTYCNIGRVFKVRGYDVLDLPAEPGADYKLVCRRIEILVETNITGDRNTGDWNTGNRNTGDWNTGDWNTGYWNTGYWNTGNRNTGNSNTGDRNTGDRNTGDRNTGDWNTGYWNTGYWNTGNRNTGDRNTGYWNTGNRNTGIGNCGHYHSGNFNIGEAPFTMFGKKANRCDVDYHLTSRLAEELTKDDPIDPTPYLSLPNATKAGIKRLHKAHIEARTKK